MIRSDQVLSLTLPDQHILRLFSDTDHTPYLPEPDSYDPFYQGTVPSIPASASAHLSDIPADK